MLIGLCSAAVCTLGFVLYILMMVFFFLKWTKKKKRRDGTTILDGSWSQIHCWCVVVHHNAAFLCCDIISLISGSTNSNVALSKAVIADITSASSHSSPLPPSHPSSPEGENRAIGFAYLGAAFSFSRLVASMIGGLAAGHYIPVSFLADNPYALPSLIGTMFNVLSFILAVVFIPETLSQSSTKKSNDKSVR